MTATQVNLTERGETVIIGLRFLDFYHQNLLFSKKKRSSPGICLSSLDFHHRNLVFSIKKKKDLRLESDSDFFQFPL